MRHLHHAFAKPADELAVGVEHVIDAHVRMVQGQVGAALEGQAIELVGREEHALLQHAGDLQVGLELALVEAVLGGLLGWEFEDVMPPDSPGKYFIARIRGLEAAAVGSIPEACT